MAEGHAAGGSLQLAELIDKYGEHLYRDLHEYAGGLNLVDILRDGSGYSPRQILLLIRGLPLESATVAMMRGGQEFRGWTQDRYLTAAVFDAVKENTFAFVSAHSKRNPPEPEPMWRPKEQVTKHKPRDKNNPFLQRLEAAKRAKAASNTQGE